MKKIVLSLGLAFAGLCFSNFNVNAADAKDYQVTGPVLEVTPDYVVVQKGEEKWQIAVNKGTKNATMKVGDKVTIYYKMVATEVEVKSGKDAKSEKSEKQKKK